VRTAVHFENGRISGPLAFAGAYSSSLMGCIEFSGWADSEVNLEFDQSRRALVARSDLFVQTLTGQLMSYAVGRPLDYYDMPAVRKVLREAAPGEYHWSSIILGIVKSTPFQMRRSES